MYPCASVSDSFLPPPFWTYTGIAMRLAPSWFSRKSGRNWYSLMRYTVVYRAPAAAVLATSGALASPPLARTATS